MLKYVHWNVTTQTPNDHLLQIWWLPGFTSFVFIGDIFGCPIINIYIMDHFEWVVSGLTEWFKLMWYINHNKPIKRRWTVTQNYGFPVVHIPNPELQKYHVHCADQPVKYILYIVFQIKSCNTTNYLLVKQTVNIKIVKLDQNTSVIGFFEASTWYNPLSLSFMCFFMAISRKCWLNSPDPVQWSNAAKRWSHGV